MMTFYIEIIDYLACNAVSAIYKTLNDRNEKTKLCINKIELLRIGPIHNFKKST